MYCFVIVFQSIVIGQVTGVTMTCQPDNLINICTVMWNVSNCILMWFVYVSTTVTIGGVCTYVPARSCRYPMPAGLPCSLDFLSLPSQPSLLYVSIIYKVVNAYCATNVALMVNK